MIYGAKIIIICAAGLFINNCHQIIMFMIPHVVIPLKKKQSNKARAITKKFSLYDEI